MTGGGNLRKFQIREDWESGFMHQRGETRNDTRLMMHVY